MSNGYRPYRDISHSINFYQECIIADRVIATSSLELTQSYDCEDTDFAIILVILLIFCVCPLGLVGIIPASLHINNVLSDDLSDIPGGIFNQLIFHLSKIFGLMIAIGILVLFVFIVDVEVIKLLFTIGSLKNRLIASFS